MICEAFHTDSDLRQAALDFQQRGPLIATAAVALYRVSAGGKDISVCVGGGGGRHYTKNYSAYFINR